MIDVGQLCVSYEGGLAALLDVTFHIAPGERVALVGANGAGKSTLLMALLGVVPIHSGVVSIGGTRLGPKTLDLIRGKAGLLFQHPDDQLFTGRVYDDVAFGLRNRGLPEEEVRRRVVGAMDSLGIGRLADRMPHRLSAGEKRSVAIASVLVMEPLALLLDEPTSFLDPRARRMLIGQVSGMKQTQLIATHDLDMALEVCGRALVLERGKLRAQGSARDILTDGTLLRECGLELPLSLSGI